MVAVVGTHAQRCGGWPCRGPGLWPSGSVIFISLSLSLSLSLVQIQCEGQGARRVGEDRRALKVHPLLGCLCSCAPQKHWKEGTLWNWPHLKTLIITHGCQKAAMPPSELETCMHRYVQGSSCPLPTKLWQEVGTGGAWSELEASVTLLLSVDTKSCSLLAGAGVSALKC